MDCIGIGVSDRHRTRRRRPHPRVGGSRQYSRIEEDDEDEYYIVSSEPGTLHEAGQFMATKTKTILVAGTKRLGIENATDTLALLPGSPGPLVNNLGADVEVVVSVFAN